MTGSTPLRRAAACLLLCAILALTCGCGSPVPPVTTPEPTPTPVPTPMPTPLPTPIPTPEPTPGPTPEPTPEPVTFAPMEYWNDPDDPYLGWAMLTPSTAGNGPLPLVVYFHGDLHENDSPEVFMEIIGVGSLHHLTDEGLAGVSAYVLCPHLRCLSWYSDENYGRLGAVKAMIDAMVADGLVDPDRIILTGHSAGTAAAQFMVQRWPGKFAALGLFSCYEYGLSALLYENALPPTRLYSGTQDVCEEFTRRFAEPLSQRGDGSCAVVYEGLDHAQIPDRAILDDPEGTGASALLTWALAQTRTHG